MNRICKFMEFCNESGSADVIDVPASIVVGGERLPLTVMTGQDFPDSIWVQIFTSYTLEIARMGIVPMHWEPGYNIIYYVDTVLVVAAASQDFSDRELRKMYIGNMTSQDIYDYFDEDDLKYPERCSLEEFVELLNADDEHNESWKVVLSRERDELYRDIAIARYRDDPSEAAKDELLKKYPELRGRLTSDEFGIT